MGSELDRLTVRDLGDPQRTINLPSLSKCTDGDLLRESLIHPGEEAACPVCRDAGFVNMTRDETDPQFGKPTACTCRLAGFDPFAYAGDRRMTFESFRMVPGTEMSFAAAEAWAGQCSIPWVVLIGGTGSGKTHLSYAAAYALYDRGADVIHREVTGLFDDLRATFDADPSKSAQKFADRFGRILDVDWLILDDLGAEKRTDWVTERLYAILNHRYVRRLPVMVTTNVRLEEIDSQSADDGRLGRIGSRLADRGISRVVFNRADDYRIHGAA